MGLSFLQCLKYLHESTVMLQPGLPIGVRHSVRLQASLLSKTPFEFQRLQRNVLILGASDPFDKQMFCLSILFMNF